MKRYQLFIYFINLLIKKYTYTNKSKHIYPQKLKIKKLIKLPTNNNNNLTTFF